MLMISSQKGQWNGGIGIPRGELRVIPTKGTVFLRNARFKLGPQIRFRGRSRWPVGELWPGPPGSRRVRVGGLLLALGCPAPILNRMGRYQMPEQQMDPTAGGKGLFGSGAEPPLKPARLSSIQERSLFETFTPFGYHGYLTSR